MSEHNFHERAFSSFTYNDGCLELAFHSYSNLQSYRIESRPKMLRPFYRLTACIERQHERILERQLGLPHKYLSGVFYVANDSLSEGRSLARFIAAEYKRLANEEEASEIIIRRRLDTRSPLLLSKVMTPCEYRNTYPPESHIYAVNPRLDEFSASAPPAGSGSPPPAWPTFRLKNESNISKD